MPLSGAIWVPSADRANVGFGRRNAVISCAFNSSILSLSASNVGFLASNLPRTSCQVKLDRWEGAFFARRPTINNTRKTSLTDRKLGRFCLAILADLSIEASCLSTADDSGCVRDILCGNENLE